MNVKQLTVLLCFAISFGASEAATLEEAFRNPPEETRPGCYWYWIKVAICNFSIVPLRSARNLGTRWKPRIIELR